MPTDDSLRLHDHEGIHHARCKPIEAGKNQTIEIAKASRFGDFLRSTLSWYRSVKISASSETLDRNSPMTAHQISLSISPIGASIAHLRLYASGIEFAVGTTVEISA